MRHLRQSEWGWSSILAGWLLQHGAGSCSTGAGNARQILQLKHKADAALLCTAACSHIPSRRASPACRLAKRQKQRQQTAAGAAGAAADQILPLRGPGSVKAEPDAQQQQQQQRAPKRQRRQ